MGVDVKSDPVYRNRLWNSFVDKVAPPQSDPDAPENDAAAASGDKKEAATVATAATAAASSFPPLRPELARVDSLRSQCSNVTDQGGQGEPHRLADFFCVIRTDRRLVKNHPKSMAKLSPTQIRLQSSIRDCYPSSQPDMEFPRHVHTFANPEGFCPAETKPSATVMTLVLTSSSGKRLYGAVLKMYDEQISHAQLQELVEASGQSVPESWLKSGEKGMKQTYHLPKCLVVLSHHAFFDAFRKFLQQLYRVYKSGVSPLPLERYIANFMHDVPLPPRGRVRVHWECFLKGTMVKIARPAPNRLPLVNFSYQPLLSVLSVSNILTVWGILLQEGRVALCSQYQSLLTPVAQALVSLLYPLEWQGMYIPVLPFGMEDVLDAPVPFLVGLEKKPSRRHYDGVVFVDLDEDVVHLGWDEGAPRTMPDLPYASAFQLRVDLESIADEVYLVPWSGIKGRMTRGNGELLENSSRETYSQMTRLSLMTPRKNDEDHRHFVLSNAERAFVDEAAERELCRQDFLTTRPEKKRQEQDTDDDDDDDNDENKENNKEGQREISIRSTLSNDGDDSAAGTTDANLFDAATEAFKLQGRSMQAHMDKFFAMMGQKYATTTAVLDPKLKQKRFEIATRFYDVDDSSAAKSAVRRAFLKFFTCQFARYEKFVKHEFRDERGNNQTNTNALLDVVWFDKRAFLKDLRVSANSQAYMSEVLETQMFERFIQERARKLREKQGTLFDEYLIVEKNKAQSQQWTSGSNQKLPTPLLEDKQWKVRQVVSPAAPYASDLAWSGVGGETYRYDEFPKLQQDQFVAHNGGVTKDKKSNTTYFLCGACGDFLWCWNWFRW